jgi:RNA polymerase sigma factor (sigma-70 family)
VALVLAFTLSETILPSRRVAQERSYCVEEPRPSPLMVTYLSRRDALARFLTARVGSREEAEDLLQELFLKVDRTPPVADLRDPAAYLFRMAANLARDRRREQHRARVREADWVDTQNIVLGSQAIDDTPSAEAAHGAKQRVAAIRKAIERLSPQCRRVFLLHKFEGLSHEDVARRVGITRSTVEKHMHTALKYLIEQLGHD